ncbi:MAG TPA: M56 family metallopeptidase [Lacipirellulaceae bacterium]|nr:M56 family metallopeptidase [Lacipirellulaceae bacterium]
MLFIANLPIADFAVKGFIILATSAVAAYCVRQKAAAIIHRVWTLGFAALLLVPTMGLVLPQRGVAVVPPVSADYLPSDFVNRASAGALRGKLNAMSSKSSRQSTPSEAEPSLDETARHSVEGDPQHGETPATSTNETLELTRPWTLLPLVSAVWGIVAAVLLSRLAVHHMILLRLLNRCRPMANDEWVRSVADAAQRLRLVRPVRLLRHAAATTPATGGTWRPVVLLPSDAEHWTMSQRRSILLHELAHVKRCDVLAQLVASIACAIHWFNPLAWCGLVQMRKLQEVACDDLVLDGGQTPTDYAETLLQIARAYRPQLLTGTVGMARGTNVERRILTILDSARHRLPLTRRAAATFATAAATVVVLLGSVRLESRTAAGNPSSQPNDAGRVKGTLAANPNTHIQAVPFTSNVPRLIAVWPGNNADNVEPITEIHLRFDHPIDPLSFQLEWRQGGFLECGQSSYLSERNELVIPIRLEAGCQHEILVNSSANGGRATSGFLSSDGLPVASAKWKFRTKTIKYPSDGQLPKVVSIDPPSGVKVGRVVLVRIRFETAMDPDSYRFPNRQPGKKDEVEFNSGVSYDVENREFTFPVLLPANWSGKIELSGFRSRDGSEAQPITIEYSTGDQRYRPDQLKSLLRRDSLAKLRNVIEKSHAAHNDLHSVSETVRSVSFESSGYAGRRYTALEGNQCHFKMQGQRQFYSDISQIMGIPFQIGSDGKECWFYSRDRIDTGEMKPTLITCKYEDIQGKKLAILDPFDFNASGLEAIVKQRRLEYLGPEKINQTDCHVVRSIDVTDIGPDGDLFVNVRRWWIDSNTDRPLQVTSDTTYGRTTLSFQTDSINQQLPITEFQPTTPSHVVRSGLEPLGEGYDTRYLQISDGSNGRMSSRWGKKGAKGSSSSGLN